MKFKIKNTQTAGFTMAEIVVVVIILGILSAMSFRVYTDVQERTRFNAALTEIVGLIKVAREFAVSSKTVYTDPADTATATIPPEGYGVYVNRAPAAESDPHLILFANLGITGPAVNQYDPGDDLIIPGEAYRLPRGVVFDKLFRLSAGEEEGVPDTGTDLGNAALILFRPPLGTAFLSNNEDPGNADNLIDTLSLQFYPENEPDRKKVITINKVGGFPELHL